MEKNTILEKLDKFLTEEDDDSRIPIFNFLYGGELFLNEENLHPYIIQRIVGKETDSIIKEYSLEIKTEIPDKNSGEVLSRLIMTNFHNWKELANRIHREYKEYVNKLQNNPIQYLIVSEAPLLDISDIENISCKYIFGETNESTVYRSTPYHAFKKSLEPGYKQANITGITKVNFEQVMITNNIAFIDLVSLPLPTISTDVRRDWSFNKGFQINEKTPLSFTLFTLAYNRFKKLYESKNRKLILSEKLKIIFMMPPKTSMGIIDYLATDPENRKEALPEELQKHIDIIIRTNDRSAKKISPALAELPLRQYRQVAVNYSNNPDIEIFLHAMKD